MFCGNIIESCSPVLFQSALTATISATFHHRHIKFTITASDEPQNHTRLHPDGILASHNSISVVGVALRSALHSFSAGPVVIAHIILIYVQRLTHDIRTVLVALLSTLRLIVLMGLIATFSAFSVLHFGLQEYRVQSLRKGRDRQCKPHPKHPTSAELVKIAHQFSTAVRFDEECAMPNANMTSLRMMAPCKRRELQFSATRLEHSVSRRSNASRPWLKPLFRRGSFDFVGSNR